MTIMIKPTKIKETCYLLVPHKIVELTGLKDSQKISLNIKKVGNKHVLEYFFENHK